MKRADMRNGFEGLSALVTTQLQRDPLSGALFLFTNEMRTRAKVLRFDSSGLCISAKRLQRARFVALWKYTDRTTEEEQCASIDAAFFPV